NARKFNSRIGTFLGKRIAVTNAARLNLDADRPRAGLRDFTLNNFEGPVRTSNLHGAHLRHGSLLRVNAGPRWVSAPGVCVPGLYPSRRNGNKLCMARMLPAFRAPPAKFSPFVWEIMMIP